MASSWVTAPDSTVSGSSGSWSFLTCRRTFIALSVAVVSLFAAARIGPKSSLKYDDDNSP